MSQDDLAKNKVSTRAKKEPEPLFFRAGVYFALLGLGHRTGIYKILCEQLGPEDANAIMDMALFSIIKLNTGRYTYDDSNPSLSTVMFDHMAFSTPKVTDSFIAEMCTQRLAASGKDTAVQNAYLQNYAGEHPNCGVWLCFDCLPLAASSTGCWYVQAVSALEGKPVYWTATQGHSPDRTALEEVLRTIRASGLQVLGVLVSSDMASPDIVATLRQLKLFYLLRLPSTSSCYQELLHLYAKELFGKVKYSFLSKVSGRVLFGFTAPVKVFADDAEESCVGLFFDGIEGAEGFKQKVSQYIDAEQAGEDVEEAQNNSEQWLFSSGFWAIASAAELSAADICERYELGKQSYQPFLILKKLLIAEHEAGAAAGQSSADAIALDDDFVTLKSRLLLTFVYSALCCELSAVCRKLKIGMPDLLENFESLLVFKVGYSNFFLQHNPDEETLQQLTECGITSYALQYSCMEFKSRRLAKTNACRELQLEPPPPRRLGRPPKAKSADSNAAPAEAGAVKRGRGRPKGSKNKKTLASMAAAALMPLPDFQPVAKRGPGRPKGSKNKKTLAREAFEASLREEALREQIKRGRGRPKGSKNKTTLAREAAEAAAAAREQELQQEVKRGRGRPKGSKNKTTLAREAAEAALRAQSVKRGPGRPKGSKNKTTLEREAASELLPTPSAKL